MDSSKFTAESETALRFRVKAEVRKRIRAIRKAASPAACAERSRRIVERLMSLDSVSGAQSVALFWPMTERNEVDLRPLDKILREQGKRIAYPFLDPETNTILFRWTTDASELAQRGARFAEPDPSSPLVELSGLDAVVVPCIAVDPRGYRIGYGSGHYDEVLAKMPSAVRIGVAYDYQLIAEVANTDGDIPMHYAITDTRTIIASLG